MQNALQSNANYDQHNAWYNSIFATEIKTEPGTSPIPQHITPPPAQTPTTPHSQLEQYLKQQHQQNLNEAMNATAVMTPSPHNNDAVQHFFDAKMQQQIYQQQQQYQQQFRQAQQAAAQNPNSAAHMPLGFNPLTPPGLAMTNMPHFYNTNMTSRSNNHQTPSPQPGSTHLQLNSPMDINSYEKLQSALTPRNTPPMEAQNAKDMNTTQHQMQQFHHLHMQQQQHQQQQQQQQQHQEHNIPKEELEIEKEHETMSNSSEDLTNLNQDESKYYESIHVPRYNSHGKLRTYPCKSCPKLYDTKAEYWEHLLTHMKPEKILRCPMYPKCPFVTEYKHFLDFHLKKHRNQKPFKCPENGCKYSCETKGMLTSHLKSHSDVYPYKCGDCDYAVKFIHSFKQHLRKYEHKPGVVLDDKGKPNPAAVIDVYGRRRGPKSKGASSSSANKRDRSSSLNKSNSCTSQLSAALQGIKMAQQQLQQQQSQKQQKQQQQQHEQPMCISPAKSNSSTTADVPTPQRQQSQNQSQQLNTAQLNNLQQQQQNLSHLLPPLASILQQNTNMAFFPYWNLNLQMLAAQQQAVVLAQLSPRKRELALQQLQNQQQQLQQQQQDLQQQQQQQHLFNPDEDTDDDDDDDDVECKSIDSAMDLSQPAEEERRTPQNTVPNSAKVEEDIKAVETPIGGSMTPTRRKGRVLQLDTVLQAQSTAGLSNEKTKSIEVAIVAASKNKHTDTHCSSEESLDTHAAGNGNNTSASSTSNDSGTATSPESDTEPVPAIKPAGAVHECKYCDIYFKDPVLYTIHMGYHSCDDVFKCNMCGEKCDGPVGLFVHMARNAHA